MNRTRERVIAQLAADYACDPQDLSRESNTVVESALRAERRRFRWRDQRLDLVTMGRGVVICANASRLAWAREHLLGCDRDALFAPATIARLQARVGDEGQTMDGPVVKFVCAPEHLTKPPQRSALACDLVEEDGLGALYEFDFEGVLGNPKSQRPNKLATVARAADRIVGMAAAGADSDELWQIGVRVEASYRERGVAQELVHRLTSGILERDKVPYYSTYAGNLASINVALAVGFRPMWLELEARDTVSDDP